MKGTNVEVPEKVRCCDRCGELASGACESCAALEERARRFVASLPPGIASLRSVEMPQAPGLTLMQHLCFCEASRREFQARRGARPAAAQVCPRGPLARLCVETAEYALAWAVMAAAMVLCAGVAWAGLRGAIALGLALWRVIH